MSIKAPPSTRDGRRIYYFNISAPALASAALAFSIFGVIAGGLGVKWHMEDQIKSAIRSQIDVAKTDIIATNRIIEKEIENAKTEVESAKREIQAANDIAKSQNNNLSEKLVGMNRRMLAMSSKMGAMDSKMGELLGRIEAIVSRGERVDEE